MVHDETATERVDTDDETRAVRRRVVLLVPMSLASVVDLAGVEVLLLHLSEMAGRKSRVRCVFCDGQTMHVGGLTRNLAAELVIRPVYDWRRLI